ncbi:unnamed protein product [Vitrella brassicaformis CCMP3155]|uniref:Uncharacterized protein n=1 Tax=Vitrella brassicaformis (strain CCMP3155) TaxID=1169540 RepID=A0A0G4E937_VITBC|nr:unnamed protein product [Vitrella brassicaformis CCMP3155]|eukprot:CEL92050.1 unnamed protein product [Vitrella brassicaformis CCMP3155]
MLRASHDATSTESSCNDWVPGMLPRASSEACRSPSGSAADEADDDRSRTSSEVRAQADARFVRGLNALGKRLLHDYRCRVRMNSKSDVIYWLNMAGSSRDVLPIVAH